MKRINELTSVSLNCSIQVLLIRSNHASTSSSFQSQQGSSAVSNQHFSSSGSNFPGHFQSTPANLHHPYLSPVNTNDSGYFGLSSSRLQFQRNSPYAAYNNTVDQSLPFQFFASHPGHNSAYMNQSRVDIRPSMDQSRSDNNLFQHPSVPCQNSSNGSTPNTSLQQSTSSTTTGARPSDSALAIAALYASRNSSGLSGPEAQQRMNNACAASANQQREYIVLNRNRLVFNLWKIWIFLKILNLR